MFGAEFGMHRACTRLLATAIAAMALLGGGVARADGPPKVLNVSFRVAESGFDPAKIVDLYSRTVTPHIFEAPYTYDPLARPPMMVPLTAESMPEVSADFRTWTIHLRHGIYFADDPAFKGKKRELVAEDYVYAYKRLVDPANKSPAISQLLDVHMIGLEALRDEALKSNKPFDYDHEIDGIRALDRYTLQFKLESPRPRLLDIVTAPDLLGAVAREVVQFYGNDIDAHPVGTGPFRLKQWRRSSLIVLERNPSYRERFYDAHPAAGDAAGQAILAKLKGRRIPMVDEVHVSIIEEDQPRWLAFLNGQTDMIGTQASPLPSDFINLAIPGGKIAPNLGKQGIQAVSQLSADIRLTLFNMDDPQVGGYTPARVALRRAIGLAYDTEREIRLLDKGQAIPAQSRIAPFTSGYDPAFKSEMSDHDPARAQALLDQFGYVDRHHHGWRDMPDGSPLVLRMATQPDQLSRQFDEQWKHDMNAVGLHIEFVPAKWPENLKAGRAGKLMMWQLGYSSASADGLEALAQCYSPEIGGQNMARFSMPAFDRIYQTMAQIQDGPERDALYLEAKKIMIAYMPYKTQVHRIATDLTQPWLIGFRRPLFWTDWWEYVDVDADMRAKRLK